MTETRTEKLYKRVAEVAESLQDGFQITDIALLLRAAVECAETFSDLGGAEKRELALEFVKAVLRRTDGPGPDMLVDPIVEAVTPPLIDLIVEAAKGLIEVNK